MRYYYKNLKTGNKLCVANPIENCDFVAITKQEYYSRINTPTTNKTLEISEYKQKLNDTDYLAIKYAEGWLSEEEYAPIKAQRQEWRDKVNELGGRE